MVDTSKLKNIFVRELNKISDINLDSYLNYIGCKLLSYGERHLDFICVDYSRPMPGGPYWFRIGVPYELAEKVLVLGGLPPYVDLVPRLTTSGVEWVAA